MTPTAPLPGGCANISRPGGDNHIDFQAHPCPHGGLGAGCSSLHLSGGHHALALRKARKLGCLGGKSGEGDPVWGLQGRCLFPPSLTARPQVCPQWTLLRALTGTAPRRPCGSGWPFPHPPAASWPPGTADWPAPVLPGHLDRRPPSQA